MARTEITVQIASPLEAKALVTDLKRAADLAQRDHSDDLGAGDRLRALAVQLEYATSRHLDTDQGVKRCPRCPPLAVAL